MSELEPPNTQPAVEGETPESHPLFDDTPPEPRARRTRSKRAKAAPTKARAAREARPASSPRVNATRAQLERGVSNTVHSIAFAVSMLDPVDGAIIAEGEANLTSAVMQTADTNPRFKRWLEDALKGGTYLQLVAAVGAIAVPIAARHMRLPPALAFAATRQPRMATDPNPDMFAPTEPAPVTHEPGRIYQDEGGAYTVDEAGNVVPVASPNGDGSAQL